MMNKYIKLLVAVVGLSGTGCGNFNTYLVPQYVLVAPVKEQLEPKPEVIPVKKEVVVAVGTKPSCAVYHMPVLPKMPVLPIKELARIAPNDMDAIDRLQLKHIDDLRDWAIKYRHVLTTSYKQYLDACGAVMPSR